QRNVEVVDLVEDAGDCRSTRRCDLHGHRFRLRDTFPPHSDCARKEKTLLQIWRIILRRNTSKIAGRRMTAAALPLSVKVGSPGLWVAGKNVQHFVVRSTAESVVELLV